MAAFTEDALRVLYLNPFPDLGGAEQSLLSLLDTLSPSVDPLLVTEREGDLSREARRLGVESRFLSFPPVVRWRRFLRSARELGKLARTERIGLFHANSPRAAFSAGLAARGTKVPVVWHARVHLGRGLRPRLLRAFSDRCIAVSRSLLDEAGISPRSSFARVVPNGVEPERIIPAPRPVRRYDEEPVRIGMIGRLEPLKGQREFIEMARTFHRNGIPAGFFIAGEILGPPPGRALRRARRYVEALTRLVETAGLGERVRFVGAVRDVTTFLDTLDILVVPSRQEGFGRVVIEGMARGLPVVASRVGGIPEIIQSGDNGWLVPPRDPLALAMACAFLVRHPHIAHQLGVRGRRRILAEFQSPMATVAILETYGDLTGHDLGGPASVRLRAGLEEELWTSLST